MDRAHSENALAARLKGGHLQNNRQHLNDKHAADYHKEQFTFGHNGNRPNRPADAEGTEVPHKYFGRVGIEHKKAEYCTDHRRCAHPCCN
ncbi:hypothetical protein D3C81_2101560 [compost metagenome]